MFIHRVFRAEYLVPVIVALCLCATPAQTPNCSLKQDQLKDTPELKGFRLGMSVDQVKSVEPLVKTGRADQFGVIKTSINPLYDPRFNHAGYADVRTISFEFLDGKLTTL